VLNHIERLWGSTKKRWKKLMVENFSWSTDEDLVNEVRKVMEEFRPQCSSLASCHLE
jgi:hypothetical protein